MSSSFVPAVKLLGPDCQARSVELIDDPYLPSGVYTLFDTYCDDNTCDCRKTMIQIAHDNKLVSVVNFGWESPKFYLRWMKPSRARELAKAMSGLSIDYSSPDLVSPEGILLFVEELMDEKWISTIKERYTRIRETAMPAMPDTPDNISRVPPKVSRNAPCPCGSGKKYKNCCL